MYYPTGKPGSSIHIHYAARRRGQPEREKRIKEVWETRARYSYSRGRTMLLREGVRVNIRERDRLYPKWGCNSELKRPSGGFCQAGGRSLSRVSAHSRGW